MKYPREIIQKADHILSRRRQIAIQEQARSLGRLSMEHPEVLNAYYSLNRLQAQHGMSLCLGADGAAELMMQIDQAEKALDGRLDAAGLTKACFEPAYTCSLCGDTGSTVGRLCRCKQEILNRLAYDQLCDISAVETCTFDNFDLEYYAEENRPSMRKVVVSCRKYVARFSHSSPNLIFTGSTGLGKTHLSLAIADGIVKSGHMVMYVSAPQLIEQLERSKFRAEEDAGDYRDLVYNCDLLVIDDLGTEMLTKYVQAETYNLVNSRLLARLPTIINTNLRRYEIEKRYDDRLASRIGGEYIEIQFQGRDIRLQKARER